VGQVQAIAQVYGLQVGTGGPLPLRSVVEAIAASVQRTFGRSIALSMAGEATTDWGLPEAESIPIALTLNELLTNAIKHSPAASEIDCAFATGDGGVHIEVSNAGRLPEGFSLDRFPGGVSGIGLIRALLPRRSATLALGQRADRVVASVSLVPPGVKKITPAP
jgi:signal transduction histidine kinase